MPYHTMTSIYSTTLVIYSLSVSYVFLPRVCDCVSWIVADQFDKDILGNLTSKQNHDHLLEQLSRKDDVDLLDDLLVEFLVMGMGDDFYKLTEDDDANRENHVIAETILQLSRQLPYQIVAWNLIRDALYEGVIHVRRTRKIADAITIACNRLDFVYKGRADYIRLRQSVKDQVPKINYKIFHYEIPKTADELRAILAVVRNTPFFKRALANFALFNTTTHVEALAVEERIRKLLKDGRNTASVQRIYDQCVSEAAEELIDLRPNDVDLSDIFRNVDEYRTIWAKKMEKMFEKEKLA